MKIATHQIKHLNIFIITWKNKMKKNICVVGLGFIGLPMLINLASLKSKNTKEKKYNVIGLEKNNSYGNNKRNMILAWKFPIHSGDKILFGKYKSLLKNNQIHITNNLEDINKSDIIIQNTL